MEATTHSHMDEAAPKGRTRRLILLLAGVLFVLVPNSEGVHAALRATLGVGGVQCC